MQEFPWQAGWAPFGNVRGGGRDASSSKAAQSSFSEKASSDGQKAHKGADQEELKRSQPIGAGGEEQRMCGLCPARDWPVRDPCFASCSVRAQRTPANNDGHVQLVQRCLRQLPHVPSQKSLQVSQKRIPVQGLSNPAATEQRAASNQKFTSRRVRGGQSTARGVASKDLSLFTKQLEQMSAMITYVQICYTVLEEKRRLEHEVKQVLCKAKPLQARESAPDVFAERMDVTFRRKCQLSEQCSRDAPKAVSLILSRCYVISAEIECAHAVAGQDMSQAVAMQAETSKVPIDASQKNQTGSDRSAWASDIATSVKESLDTADMPGQVINLFQPEKQEEQDRFAETHLPQEQQIILCCPSGVIWEGRLPKSPLCPFRFFLQVACEALGQLPGKIMLLHGAVVLSADNITACLSSCSICQITAVVDKAPMARRRAIRKWKRMVDDPPPLQESSDDDVQAAPGAADVREDSSDSDADADSTTDFLWQSWFLRSSNIGGGCADASSSHAAQSSSSSECSVSCLEEKGRDPNADCNQRKLKPCILLGGGEGAQNPHDAVHDETVSKEHASYTRDPRTRPTQRCGHQCYINAVFTGLCASDNVRSVFWGTAITLMSDHEALWSKLMSVAKSQASLQDKDLRTVHDKGVGTHAQRLAATYWEARLEPTGQPFVPRLLWHSFYNYGEGETQGDVHELVNKLSAPGENDELAMQMRMKLLTEYSCIDCSEPHPLLQESADHATMLSVPIFSDASETHGPQKIGTVQDAIEAFFEPERARVSDQGVLMYQGRVWRCSVCRSKSLPNRQLRLEAIPNTLVVHLKRSKYVQTIAGEYAEELLDHQVTAQDEVALGDARYRLRSQIFHVGGAKGGHYYCYCRYSGDDQSWWYYNDTMRRRADDLSLEQGKLYLCVYDKVQAEHCSRPGSSGQENGPSTSAGNPSGKRLPNAPATKRSGSAASSEVFENAEIRKREEAARMERENQRQQEEEKRRARLAAQMHLSVWYHVCQLEQIRRIIIWL